MNERLVVVSIDTEVDKAADWSISAPPTFASVTHAVPDVLSPLFDRFGVVPTYFLSPEVIEHQPSVAVLAALGDRAELATHLHAQFVEPERELWPHTMAGGRADGIQATLAPDVEAAKLVNLTDAFRIAFGVGPTSFRAGRFALGEHTLATLARLGYEVDSSVTPGVRWRYDEGTIDHRRWGPAPVRVATADGPIVELPVSIRHRLPARLLAGAHPRVAAAAGRLLGRSARAQWARPSWGSDADLVDLVTSWRWPVLVIMFHNIEVVPGASPYAADAADVRRVLDRLELLIARCAERGDRFVGITEAARSTGVVAG